MESTAKTVTLLHVVRRHGEQLVHFYDGARMAKDGLLSIPTDKPEWIRRAWNSGYYLSPSTGERLGTWAEVEAEIEKQNAKSVKSTKSTGDKVEDSDAGRQPKAKDRVRES